jgi:type 1 glutamine amidotransferase
MWTRTYGKGKVACFSLGHCPKTFKIEEVRKILFNALYYISN